MFIVSSEEFRVLCVHCRPPTRHAELDTSTGHRYRTRGPAIPPQDSKHDADHKRHLRAAAWYLTNRINLALDTAGRYRRLAITLPTMSVGLLVLAADAIIGRDSRLDASLYAGLAIAMLWLTADIYESAVLIDGEDRPHRSLAAVVSFSTTLAVVKLEGILGLWNHLPSLVIGGATLTAALLLFAGADRASPKAAAPGPRALLVIGGSLFGVAALIEVFGSSSRGVVLYPAGLGVVGVAALLLAFFEAKLLARMVTYAIR